MAGPCPGSRIVAHYALSAPASLPVLGSIPILSAIPTTLWTSTFMPAGVSLGAVVRTDDRTRAFYPLKTRKTHDALRGQALYLPTGLIKSRLQEVIDKFRLEREPAFYILRAVFDIDDTSTFQAFDNAFYFFDAPSPKNPAQVELNMANSLSPTGSSSRLLWLANLNTEYHPAKEYRRTSIICTIGPKTNSVEKINMLRKVGCNVVRMNFSHGSYDYHQSVIDHAKEAESLQPGRPLAIALDTKGPEIRTGNTVNDDDIPISAGAVMNITTDEKYATASDNKNMYVDYKNITKVIDKGRTIYVDDGVLSFEVLDVVDRKTLRVRCLNNGKISSKKGVNLPKTDVDLPALSEKDQNDLRFGVKNKVDMVFASFIRRGEDIKAIREVLGERGKEIQIIAKIENQQGVNNFDEILKETDGVMVARGDLGIEIPPSQVFTAQKMMIAKCNMAGKPVICATQMLESMTYNPRPTRAEVSDVGNAVTDGADCVMLSGETAKGNYPRESVLMMHDTCLAAEIAIPYVSHFDELRSLCPRPTGVTESCAISAVSSSIELGAGAILVLTTSGNSARLISKYRPVCPIIMVTRNGTAARYSHLYRGVYPFLFAEQKPDFSRSPWQEDVDRRLKFGIEQAIKLGVLSRGDQVVCVQGWRGGQGHTNTIRVVPAEKDLGLTEY